MSSKLFPKPPSLSARAESPVAYCGSQSDERGTQVASFRLSVPVRLLRIDRPNPANGLPLQPEVNWRNGSPISGQRATRSTDSRTAPNPHQQLELRRSAMFGNAGIPRHAQCDERQISAVPHATAANQARRPCVRPSGVRLGFNFHGKLFPARQSRRFGTPSGVRPIRIRRRHKKNQPARPGHRRLGTSSFVVAHQRRDPRCKARCPGRTSPHVWHTNRYKASSSIHSPAASPAMSRDAGRC